MTEDCRHQIISGHYNRVIPSQSATQRNPVTPPHIVHLFLPSLYRLQVTKAKEMDSWKRPSNYWDVSKVKGRKTVSQQLPSLIPLDVWTVLGYGREAPQVTGAGSLDCRVRLSGTDRRQPTRTYGRARQRRRGSDKPPPDLCVSTLTGTCLYVLTIILFREVSFATWELWEGASLLFLFVDVNLLPLKWNIWLHEKKNGV